MSWTKLLTPAWLGTSGAAKQLNTTVKDIEKRIVAGEFLTRQTTPNVTEIKFHKTNGMPKYILAVPGAPDPTPPTTAVTNLYRLIGDDFTRRFDILATNVKRQLLEEFINAPNFIHSDVEDLLADLSAGLIQTQKTACLNAEITEEQKQDFESRLDNTLAEAIIIIRDCFSTFGDRTSGAFQLETAKQLGIPLA